MTVGKCTIVKVKNSVIMFGFPLFLHRKVTKALMSKSRLCEVMLVYCQFCKLLKIVG